MKVLNICRFLPIEGFPAENDITLKIYADLKKNHGVDSLFVMPLAHIPKWATYFKKSLKNRYQIINKKDYIDRKHKLPIIFFQNNFPFPIKLVKKNRFLSASMQFKFYKSFLYKHLDCYKPNVVHAHTIDDAYYAYKIKLKYGTPYLITLRGRYTDKYKMPLIKNILEGADQIITPTYQIYINLKNIVHIELIPHGVDKNWYIKKEKVFSQDTLRMITVARLHDWKNIHTVIQSVTNLIHKGKKINYSIVGKGYYEGSLKELVIKNNIQEHVKFYGFKSPDELRELYTNNDVFILLSYPETFGRVYYEAAAQGLLLVGRKDTGIDGYFNNEEAFIIDPSIEQTMKTLKNINKEVFDKMVRQSNKKILDFKNDKIIDKYYDVLINILN